MSKDIYSVSLHDLLPESLKQDPFISAAAEAISIEMRAISFEARKVLLYQHIDELPEEVIDLLAWQDHVDFYDPSLPLEQKRELVKQSIPTHLVKGTPWAVEQVVSTVFADGKVMEWFEYGGQPYHFKVTTKGAIPDEATLQALFRAIEVVKRESTRLESVSIERESQINMYVGAVFSRIKITMIKPEVV